MEIKSIYCIGALLLLSLASVKADAEYKRKFGNEFITDMKQYHAELMHQNMNHLEELFQTLLRDFEPTATEKHDFNEHLDEIKGIQTQIGNSVTIDVVKKVKTFGQKIIYELVLLNFDPSVVTNPNRQRVLKRAMETSGTAEKQDMKAFQRKIYKRYHEMYQNIPDAELQQYPEYRQIDQTMKRIADRSPNESATLPNLMEYLGLFRTLSEFFEVPEYKEIFNV